MVDLSHNVHLSAPWKSNRCPDMEYTPLAAVFVRHNRTRRTATFDSLLTLRTHLTTHSSVSVITRTLTAEQPSYLICLSY